MSIRNEQAASRDLGSSLGGTTSAAIDQMIRWPFWFTGATMDLVAQGMQRMTAPLNWTMGSNDRSGSTQSASVSAGTRNSGASMSAGGNWGGTDWGFSSSSQSQGQGQSYGSGDDQDLSGDDLKYVVWSILYCKPGYETVLEANQADIVNYSADGASFAAVKIAKYLEKARHGRTERPSLWVEKGYPETSANSRREPSATVAGATTMQAAPDRGWRIPADDQKYLKFVYRVERRLPKEEPEVTRIERVTIERDTATTRTTAVS